MDKDFTRGFWILVSAFHYSIASDPWEGKETRNVLEELMCQARKSAAAMSDFPVFDHDRWHSIQDRWDEYSRLRKLDPNFIG